MEAAVTRAPAASVFTLSHNKPGFVTQAIESVLAQDYDDFEYWIIENSTDDGVTRQAIAPLLGDPRIIYEEVDLTAEERAWCYVPAMLLNRYYPKANGDVIFYLSDDDLFDPRVIRRSMATLTPGKHVAWFSMQIMNDWGGGMSPVAVILAYREAGRETAMWSVDCQIDGGQVAHRKACLDKIGQPYFPETAEPGQARHADGLFLQRLAGYYKFYPVPEPAEFMLTHRRTPLSTWDKV